MGARSGRGGFTLLELVISLAVVSALLVLLLPVLTTARMSSHRALCAGNQRLLGHAWSNYLDSNDQRFPVLLVQGAWMYGGARFSSLDGSPFLDYDRPLNRFLPVHRLNGPGVILFECPADRGITDERSRVGTGRRSAFEAFGTSYRANTKLLGGRGGGGPGGLRRLEITTSPSRLVVMGDPVWYEVREKTGRLASWHGMTAAGNLLFLDGSVRFLTIDPKPKIGPAVFDPLAPDLAFPVKGTGPNADAP